MHSEAILAQLARQAAKQHGLFTTGQALGLGLTRSGIQRCVRKHLFLRIHRGVYAFSGSPATWRRELLAACLRIPGRTWASHRSAAAFWQLDGFEETLIEVTTTGNLTQCASISVHRRRSVPTEDVTHVTGIPVTTVSRTLMDLGEVVPHDIVEQALECALRRRICREDRLLSRARIRSTSGLRGPNILREVIEQRGKVPPAESLLEVRFIQFVRRYHLPTPTRQVAVSRLNGRLARVDFFYEERKVVVEADGRSHHLRRAQWEADLRRRNQLVAGGYKVMHATHERIVNDPERLATELRAVLAR